MKNTVLLAVLISSWFGLLIVYERGISVVSQEKIQDLQLQIADINVTLKQMQTNQAESITLQKAQLAALSESNDLQKLHGQQLSPR